MSFGKLGAIGTGFGRLGSRGGGSLLAAPVLAMAGSWTSADSTPDFSATFPSSVTTGDSFRIQIQVASFDWSAPLSDTAHAITSGEASGHAVSLAGSALGNGNYEARANVTHGTTTAWSNIVSFTISATVTSTFYILGF